VRRGSLLLVLPLACCAGNPSALDPAGPGAGAIARLTWLFVVVCGVIYALVMLAFALALQQARRRQAAPLLPAVPPGHDRFRNAAIAVAAGLSALVLSAFVGATWATDRSLIGLEIKPAVDVTVTAHQWWWEIRYEDSSPARTFTTANELHLPVGQPARIRLVSPDVIHSLWVPNIMGKQDVIPGRVNTIWLTASRNGEWHGRCAEFCGIQHAHMELLVVAEPPAWFDGWRDAQVAPAAQPATDAERHGQQVFVEGDCVICHVVRGSPATGTSGTAPDLTHLKSRRFIAAGTLPNNKGYLGGWIADAQAHKPGVRMPVNLMSSDDFQDLLAWLETLK
jgi:cytochrome c oxidase subunit 2